jgi:hypothetical protein
MMIELSSFYLVRWFIAFYAIKIEINIHTDLQVILGLGE